MERLYVSVIWGDAGQSRSNKPKIIEQTSRLIGIASTFAMLVVSTGYLALGWGS